MAKRNIQYLNQDEPSFITQFKSRVGYKEGPNVDTKRQELERDQSGSDAEDEQPTVVALKKGDITQEEFDKIKNDGTVEENSETRLAAGDNTSGSQEVPTDGKILFKKPVKRNSDSSDLNPSTKKKKESKKTDKVDKKKSKGVKNTKLLSFDDEEDD